MFAERRDLLERTILLAVSTSPCTPLDLMRPEDRAVVALARFARYSVVDIGLAIDIDVTMVKTRMLRGLNTVARAPPCMPPDPRARVRTVAAVPFLTIPDP